MATKVFKTDWHGVLKLAGIPATFKSSSTVVSKEEVIYKVKEYCRTKKSKTFPTGSERRSLGVSPYIKSYWNNLEEMSEEICIPFAVNDRAAVNKASFTNIINDIKKRYAVLGYPPHPEQCCFSLIAMKKLDITWNNLLEFIGITPLESIQSTLPPMSREEILNSARHFLARNKADYLPEKGKICKSEKYINYYWGNRQNLAYELGVPLKRDAEVIIDEIKDLYASLGYPPHAKDYVNAKEARKKLHTNWHGILKQANIKATFCSPHANYSKEEVIYKTRRLMMNFRLEFLPSRDMLFLTSIPFHFFSDYWKNRTEMAKEIHVPLSNDDQLEF